MARMPNYFYNGGQAAVNASPWAAAASSLGQALFGDPREIRAREAAEQEGQLRNLEMEKLQLGLETARAEAESNATFAKSIEDWQRTRGQPQPAASPLGGVFAEQDPSTGGAAQGQPMPPLTTSAAPPAPSLAGVADVADAYGFGGIPGVDEAALTTVRDDTAALPQGQPSASPLGQAFAEPDQAPQSPQMRSISDALNAMNDFEIMAIAQEPTAAGKRKVFNDIMLKRGEEARKLQGTPGMPVGETREERDDWIIVNGDPSSPEYALVYNRKFEQPTYREGMNEQGQKILVPVYPPVPQGVRRPTGTAQQQQAVAQQSSAAPAPQGGGGAPAPQGAAAPASGPGGTILNPNPEPYPADVARNLTAAKNAIAEVNNAAAILMPNGKWDRSAQLGSARSSGTDLTDQVFNSAMSYVSPEGQQAAASLTGALNMMLASFSGQAVTPSEMGRFSNVLLPTFAENPVVAEAKMKRLQRWATNMQAAFERGRGQPIPLEDMFTAAGMAGGNDTPTQPAAPPPSTGGGKVWILNDEGVLVPEQ